MIEDEDVLKDAFAIAKTLRNDAHPRESQLLIEGDGPLVAGYDRIELKAREAMGGQLIQAVLHQGAADALPPSVLSHRIAGIGYMGTAPYVIGVQDVKAADASFVIFGHGRARLALEERERLPISGERADLRKGIRRSHHFVPDGPQSTHIIRLEWPDPHGFAPLSQHGCHRVRPSCTTQEGDSAQPAVFDINKGHIVATPIATAGR